MALLEDAVDPIEAVRVISLAIAHPKWSQCLKLEDNDGVRLQAYALRYGLRRHYDLGSWVEAIFSDTCPISSQGHGLLRQLATLASRSDHPNHWILDQIIVPAEVCRFSPDQWQRGLEEDRVRAWLGKRVFAINRKTFGTISGPATPDLHFFYNVMTAQGASLKDARWLSAWQFSLGQAIEVVLGMVLPPSFDIAGKRAWWADREPAVEELFDCFEQERGVVWAILDMAGDAYLWEEMMDRIRSRKEAGCLENEWPSCGDPCEDQARRL